MKKELKIEISVGTLRIHNIEYSPKTGTHVYDITIEQEGKKSVNVGIGMGRKNKNRGLLYSVIKVLPIAIVHSGIDLQELTGISVPLFQNVEKENL